MVWCVVSVHVVIVFAHRAHQFTRHATTARLLNVGAEDVNLVPHSCAIGAVQSFGPCPCCGEFGKRTEMG